MYRFMRILRNAWGKKFGLFAPGLILEFGCYFLKTESELVLKSRRVIPTRLLQSGFEFAFPTWEAAAKDLVEKMRHSRKG